MLLTDIVTADASSIIASVVEEAVDDVEEEDKEPQESKNSIRIHRIAEKVMPFKISLNIEGNFSQIWSSLYDQ